MSQLILVVILLILAGAVIRGFHRGFLRTALSMLSLVITIILVTILQPYVSTALREYTPLGDAIARAVYENMEDASRDVFPSGEEAAIQEETVVTAQQQLQWLEKCSIPQAIRDQILKGTEQASDAFAKSASQYVADTVLNILSFLITFLLVFLLIRFLFVAFDIVGHIPVLHGINKWLGAVLGLCQGVFLVWLLCLVVTLILPSELGGEIFAAISENPILSLLYNGSLSLGKTL